MIPSVIMAVSLLGALFEPALAPGAEAAPAPEPVVYDVVITAYSSTPDQTDSTPFITASGKRVRHGIIAANFLEFGTLVKIPELFGDEIFVVEDRMHRRFSDRVDIWMSTRVEAKRFGIQRVRIVIVEETDADS